MPENSPALPDFTRWPSFPFEGDMRVKPLATPVDVEPPRSGEDAADCVACNTPDDAYIWVSDRWRVRAMDRPTGLPVVLILECRSHLDLGDLPNLLAAELGVMTVRLERAIRSLDDVARVHVNRWGDGSAHLHMWFLARPYGRLQLRGTFLSLWDDILPVIPEQHWRQNLAHVAAWLAEFGGRAVAEPPHIEWLSPSRISESPSAEAPTDTADADSQSGVGQDPPIGAESQVATDAVGTSSRRPADLADVQSNGSNASSGYAAAEPTQDLSGSAARAAEMVAQSTAGDPPSAAAESRATSAQPHASTGDAQSVAATEAGPSEARVTPSRNGETARPVEDASSSAAEPVSASFTNDDPAESENEPFGPTKPPANQPAADDEQEAIVVDSESTAGNGPAVPHQATTVSDSADHSAMSAGRPGSAN